MTSAGSRPAASFFGRLPSPIVCALILVFAAPGCVSQMCNDQVSASGRYRVTFVELYDASTHFMSTSPPGSSMPCAGASGLGPGSVVEVKGTGSSSGPGCVSVVADFVSVPDTVHVAGPPTTMLGASRLKIGGAGFLVAGASVTAPGGTGDLVIDLLTGPGATDIFETPVAGQFPPVIAVGTFYSGQPVSGCYDEYVVQLAQE